MKRNLRVERLYPLGDYRNIKFYDEILDIPDELAFNKEVIGNLQLLMMLECDRGFIEYKKILGGTATGTNVEEMVSYIDDLREKTLSKLINFVNNKHEGEKNE